MKGAIILKRSSRRLINKMVYENSAEYPWAKFKDFIFSEDGKYIEKVLLVTESLIPVPYVVEFSDFQNIGDKRAVLRPGIKPSPGKIEKESPFLFSNLKKQKVKRNGHTEKFFDVNFDNLDYFHFAIRSKVYVNFFAQASDGIRVGQWDLQMDKMKEIPFIIPPAEEQIAIVEHVRAVMPKYDTLIEKLQEEIKALEEYKAKLIADVVTASVGHIPNINTKVGFSLIRPL